MEEVTYPRHWDEDGQPYDKKPWTDMGQTKEEWERNRIPSHWDGDTYIGPEPGEEPQPPAFEDQNFDAPTYVTLARIYDLLAVIAISLNPQGAGAILDLHEDGHLKGSPPYLKLDDDAL